MIKNYIEFKHNNGNEYAVIHKDDKSKVVIYDHEIRALKRIAKKYGYENIDDEARIVKNAREIREEFDKTRPEYILNRKSKATGLRILAGALAIFTIGTVSRITGAFENKLPQQQDNSSITVPVDDEDIVKVTKYTTDYEKDKFIIEDNTQEINDMFNEEVFNYNYEDRSESINMENANQYDDIFQKYAKMYGVDAELLKAMACQESGGNHYDYIEEGPATGIMQIENDCHIGYTTYAYNIETKEFDEIFVTEDNIKDIDTNIRLGAMTLRNCLEYYDYNIPLAIQAYNFGMGNVDEVIAYCTTSNNISSDEIINNSTNNKWLDYRNQIDVGDNQYLEHVLSYLGDNKTITIQDRDGNNHSLLIKNDYTLTKQAHI